jgi:hypothetical protein
LLKNGERQTPIGSVALVDIFWPTFAENGINVIDPSGDKTPP